jgi:uncharacterized protein (DUF1697 family)
VNVGGTGKLPMSDLKKICGQAGFGRIETYIASGNVVFGSKAPPPAVKAELTTRLRSYAGKEVGVIVRTAAEMVKALAANPFGGTDPKRSYVIFLDASPPVDALAQVSGRHDEELRLGRAGNLCLLPDRRGQIEAPYSRGEDRHSPQHQHGRKTGRDRIGSIGRAVRSSATGAVRAPGCPYLRRSSRPAGSLGTAAGRR